MPRVYLTGHMNVASERIDAVLSAVTDHIALTRAEKGCLSFQVTPCLNVHLGKLGVARFEWEK